VLGLLRHGRITLGLVILRLEFEILMDDHDLVHMVSVCVSVTVSNFVLMWQPLSRYNVLGARGPSTSYGKTFCEFVMKIPIQPHLVRFFGGIIYLAPSQMTLCRRGHSYDVPRVVYDLTKRLFILRSLYK